MEKEKYKLLIGKKIKIKNPIGLCNICGSKELFYEYKETKKQYKKILICGDCNTIIYIGKQEK